MAKKIANIIRGKRSKSKEFRFVLHSSNGNVIAFGEHYKRRSGAITCLKNNFPQFKVVDLTKLHK